MPAKPKAKEKEEKKPGLLSGVPLGSALDAVDGVGSFLFKMFLSRYQVEDRIRHVKEEAREKAEELREEAIRTGYAIKKAFFRTIIEGVLLTTALLALIIGLILAISDIYPIKYVLVGYGLLVTIIVLAKLKTEA